VSTVKISKYWLASNALMLGIMMAVVGYTALLMAYSNITGSAEGSRQLTMPLRVLIVAFLALTFATSVKRVRNPAILFFLLFSVAYYLRIFVELVAGGQDLYRTPLEIFLYFTSFVVLPFLLISMIQVDRHMLQKVLIALLLGGTIFSLTTLTYYYDHVGQVGRLSSTVDDASISPLVVSYTSAMILAITAVYWSLNETKPKVKVVLLVLSGLLFVPLSLGASRGSFVALLLVVLFFLAFNKGIKKRVSLFAVVVIASGLFSVLLEYLGRGLISRVLGIQAAIETHSSSAIRLVMWSDGWQQFLSSPIFGSSLQLETFQFHPHNIFIEILLSTGVVGFILFLGFLFFVSISAVRIVRRKPECSWVVVIFLVGLANNMFSSAVWAASTLALGAALVIAVDRSLVSNSLAPG
jgi:hypothetical protein